MFSTANSFVYIFSSVHKKLRWFKVGEMSTEHLGGSQVWKGGCSDESGERARKKCDVVEVMHLQKHTFKPYCRSSKPCGSQRSKRRKVPVCRAVWKRPIRLNGEVGDGGEDGTQGQSLRSQRLGERVNTKRTGREEQWTCWKVTQTRFMRISMLVLLFTDNRVSFFLFQ